MESFSSVKRHEEPLKSDHIDQIVALLNYSLGEQYTNFDTLNSQSDRNDSKLLFLRSNTTEEVIAAAVVQVYDTLDDFLENAPQDQRGNVERLIQDSYTSGKIGLLKTMAVDPDFRGKGFGRKLTRMALDQFQAWRVANVYAFGWMDHDGCHIQNTLESSGFEVVSHLTDFYHQESLDHKFNCPSCGDTCACSIKLFERVM